MDQSVDAYPAKNNDNDERENIYITSLLLEHL